MSNFTCPRRNEFGAYGRGVENEDTWRENNTCSYCGSLNQDELMRHLEEGNIRLDPTDKNYKVYVEGLPDPDAGKPTIYSSANFEQTGEGWVKVTPENIDTLPLSKWQRENYNDGKHWVKVEPTRALAHHKFYFPHLTKEQKIRFVELLNAERLNIGYPGRFYVSPYFIEMKK